MTNCVPLQQQGVVACAQCPHRAHASCTGGDTLRRILFPGYGLYTDPFDPGMQDMQEILEEGPVVPHMIRFMSGWRAQWSRRIAAAKAQQRAMESLERFSGVLTGSETQQLHALIGRRVTLLGHVSNHLIGVARKTRSPSYLVCAANTNTFRSHLTPWVIAVDGAVLQAALADDAPSARIWASSFNPRPSARPARSLPLSRSLDWFNKYVGSFDARAIKRIA